MHTLQKFEHNLQWQVIFDLQLVKIIIEIEFSMAKKLKEEQWIKSILDELYSNYIIKETKLYGVQYLLPFLEAGKLKDLERKFKKYNDQLTQIQFVQLWTSFLHFPMHQKCQLVHGLLKVFKDIDTDDSNTLSWSQFTQYIIDNFEKNNRNNGITESQLDANQIINKAHQYQDKHYILSNKYIDKLTHSNYVIKLRSDNKKRLIVLQQKANKLKLVNIEKQEREIRLTNIIPEKIYIINFQYSARENKICLLCSNMNIYFIQITSQFNKICSFYFDIIQINVWYAHQFGAWITSGLDSKIRIWKFNKYTNQQVEENLKAQGYSKICTKTNKIHRILEGHTDIVTGVIEMKNPKFFATCSKDGKVYLWDLEKQSLLYELNSRQLSGRAIRGIDYYENYGNYLITYGFQSQVNIWCPAFSFSKPFIKSLQGHYNSVLLAKFTKPNPYVVTIDQKNSIRIWDIRFFTLIQLINSQKIQINDILFLTEDIFAVAGKRIIYYDNSMNRKIKNQFDVDVFSTEILYSQTYDILIVITKCDIRFYDAKTGKLKHVLKRAHNYNKYNMISKNGKKLFTLNNNKIQQINLKHFNKIYDVRENHYQKYQIQQRFLNQCKYLLLQDYQILIVGDIQSKITYIHFASQGKIQLKTLIGGHRQSSIAAITSRNNLLFSASKNGIITTWQLDTGRYIQHFQLQNQCIQDILTVKNKNYLIVKGLDSIYFIGNNILKFSGRCHQIIQNYCLISDKGTIQLYEIAQIQNLIQIKENEQNNIQAHILYRRDQIDASKKLSQAKSKKIILNTINCIYQINAHYQQITQLKYSYSMNGVISGSIDKTIKVWKIEQKKLKCMCSLSLIEQFQCKWHFAENIIKKQIQEISKTLQFIQKVQDICLNPIQIRSTIKRIIFKIFGQQRKVYLKSKKIEKINNFFEGDQQKLKHQDKYKNQLKELLLTLEIDQKKRQKRNKVNRLLKQKQYVRNSENTSNYNENTDIKNINQKTEVQIFSKSKNSSSIFRKTQKKIYSRPFTSNIFLSKNRSIHSSQNQPWIFKKDSDQQLYKGTNSSYKDKKLKKQSSHLNLHYTRPSTGCKSSNNFFQHISKK